MKKTPDGTVLCDRCITGTPLENWGHNNYCPECVAILKQRWAEATKDWNPDNPMPLRIGDRTERPGVHSNLTLENECHLFDNGDSLYAHYHINHEAIHYLLTSLIGLRGSFRYDNVYRHPKFHEYWWT